MALKILGEVADIATIGAIWAEPAASAREATKVRKAQALRGTCRRRFWRCAALTHEAGSIRPPTVGGVTTRTSGGFG